MADSLPTLSGDALWLHPGSSMLSMALQHGQVCVNQGPWHGHYRTYQNPAFSQQCLDLCFSGRRNGGTRFEEQVPHHMKPLGRRVYRNYNNQQMMVFVNSDNLVTDGSPGTKVSCDLNCFLCVMEFVHCHPSQSKSSLRLGFHECLPTVSFNGKEPTGHWSFHEFPNIHKAPTGIDLHHSVLRVAFHWDGDESKQETTLYGLVVGTTDVYRAIGMVDSTGASRIYCDSELSLLSKWHIVLVGV